MNLLEYLHKAKECGYETLIAAYALIELDMWHTYDNKHDIETILNQLEQMEFTYIDNKGEIKIRPDVSINEVVNKYNSIFR